MKEYDWKNIVQSKTDKELEDFFKKKYFFNIESRYCALIEMKNRNITEIERFQKELLNECIAQLSSLSKPRLKDYLIMINPYITLSLFIFFLINLLYDINRLTLNNFWVIGTIFFGFGGFIALIISRWRITIINKNKLKKKERIQKIIEDLNY